METKQFDELTIEEIAILTDEQLQNYVRLEKAKQGVKFAAEPPFLVLEDLPEPNINMFGLNGIGDKLMFKDIETFNRFLKFIKENGIYSVEYNYEVGYKYHFSKEIKTNGEENFMYSKLVYDEAIFLKYKNALTNNNKANEKYERDLKEYRDYIQNNKYIEDDIYIKFNECYEEMKNRINMLNLFKSQYYELANKDFNIAMNFLKKAYSINSETEDLIKKEFNIPSEEFVF